MRPARTALLLLIALAAAAARGDTTVPSRPIAPVPPGALPRDTSSSARALLLAMGAAVAEVRDYTMTLVKQEWDDKALGSEETLVSKWARPCSVYFKRLSPPHLGREILYVNGWNSDLLRVSLGTFPNLRLNLDPFGKLAMSGSRHPVMETSLVSLVELVLRNFRDADGRGEARIQELPAEIVAGRSCRHVVLTAPAGGATYQIARGETLWDVARRSHQSISPILQANRDRGWSTPADGPVGATVVVPNYYATKIDLCVDPDLELPVRALIYDQTGTLFERFEYRDLRVNAGLTARDFSTSNPEYRF